MEKDHLLNSRLIFCIWFQVKINTISEVTLKEVTINKAEVVDVTARRY